MMNAEDKLFKNVDRLMLHDSLKKNEVLTVWERTFLSSKTRKRKNSSVLNVKNSDRRDRVAWVVWSVSFDAMQDRANAAK